MRTINTAVRKRLCVYGGRWVWIQNGVSVAVVVGGIHSAIRTGGQGIDVPMSKLLVERRARPRTKGSI